MEKTGLMEFGITEKEADLYLVLLSMGSTTAGPVVKRTGLPWSSVYSMLERLVEKGLASYVVKSKKTYFTATDPKRFLVQLREKERRFEGMIPELMQIKETALEKEDTRIYVGWEGMRSVFEILLNNMEPGEDEHLVIGISNMLETSRILQYFYNWDRRRAAKGVPCRFIVGEGLKQYFNQTKDLPNTEFRTLAGLRDAPITVDIYKNKTIITIWTEKPYLIEVDNKEFADGFRNYFELFWRISKPKTD